ncbi:hypothetical protein [Undibacterium curvum]|uniref:Uncharacterized protein n=1 Tax=Undibacterium curvum TaxID=2762294 RepID=A0ABR7A0B5_9BURK|nr:hypothetical protein [Undibacterium curvum]MBC3930361.1 hypothetical protein [Undibacterium curvum]
MNKQNLMLIGALVAIAVIWKKRTVPITTGATTIVQKPVEAVNAGIVPQGLKQLLTGGTDVALPFFPREPRDPMGFPVDTVNTGIVQPGFKQLLTGGNDVALPFFPRDPMGFPVDSGA